MRHQVRRRAHDAIHAALAILYGADLLIGTDRRGQRGHQAGARQFRLGFVVVDVVFAYDFQFGRIARLPGAQDDAGVGTPEFLADGAHQPEAGVAAFHDHVEQHHGDVLRAFHHAKRFGGRMGVQALQRPARHDQVLQGEQRGRMDILLVIHDQHAPGRQRAGRRRWRIRAIIDDVDQLVACARHVFVAHGAGSLLSGAFIGSSISKRVPVPRLLATWICPPSTRVTRL